MTSLYQRLQEVDEKSPNYRRDLKEILEPCRKNPVINGAINGEYQLADLLNGNFKMYKEESKLVKSSDGNLHKRNIERKLNREEKREIKESLGLRNLSPKETIKLYVGSTIAGVSFLGSYGLYLAGLAGSFKANKEYIIILAGLGALTGIATVTGLIIHDVKHNNKGRKKVIPFIDNKIKEAYSSE